MLRVFALFLAAVMWVCPVWPAHAKKIALTVGVNAYDNLPADRQLEKAVNHARAIAAALKGLGFEADVAENVDRRRFNEIWSQFLNRIEPRDIVAFQFSGHGIRDRWGQLPCDERRAKGFAKRKKPYDG